MLRSVIRYVIFLSSHRRLPSSPPPPPPVLLVHHRQYRTWFTFTMTDSITDGPNHKRARTSEILDGTSSFATFAPNQEKKQTKKERAHNKRMQKKVEHQNQGRHEETSHFEIRDLLGELRVLELEEQKKAGRKHWEEAFEKWGCTSKGRHGQIVTVKIERLGAHGDGLAVLKDDQTGENFRILEVPFALPGELVKAKIYSHERDSFLSRGQLTEIIESSPDRALKEGEVVVDVTKISPELEQVRKFYGPRVQCKYFGTCSGCQFQALSYDKQLEIKQTVVRTAFENFANLEPNLVPETGPTLPSPLQYQYRTKLTPHFSIKPVQKSTEPLPVDDDHAIGFDRKFLIKGKDKILDIEECVIATEVINEALAIKREEEKKQISLGRYKRDSTLLFRQSLTHLDKKKQESTKEAVDAPDHSICISDYHLVVRERIGPIELQQKAGSFFQNNSSILPSLIDYIAEAVTSERPTSGGDPTQNNYLIDTYCGSGLFAITLAKHFTEIVGVEIDPNSIKYAEQNALYNRGKGRGKIKFITGNSEVIFKDIKFPPDQTTIIIDPPRKGCHPDFLNQLLDFNPATIIYVSCNVHTQARDIGWLVNESGKRAKTTNDATKQIRIESVRAADLFANTHHAEGVAVLRRALI